MRDFSPDFGTIDPVTREQVIMLIDLPDDLRAGAVVVLPDGRLAVTWHPEGLASLYHPGWLWRHRPEAPAGSDLPRRHQWQPGRARHTPLVRVEGGAIRAGDEAALGAWLTAIHVDGLSTREYVPGLQFLFCLHNSGSGGDSIFVDGYAVAEQLRAESPADFEMLATVAVAFGTRNRDSDHRFHAPVLEPDAAGDLVTVRYTWWLRNPMSGDSATIKAFYTAFKRFQRLANDPGNQLQLRLRAGDMACSTTAACCTAAPPSIRLPAAAGCAAATASGRNSSPGCGCWRGGRAAAPGRAGFAAGGAGRHLTAASPEVTGAPGNLKGTIHHRRRDRRRCNPGTQSARAP